MSMHAVSTGYHRAALSFAGVSEAADQVLGPVIVLLSRRQRPKSGPRVSWGSVPEDPTTRSGQAIRNVIVHGGDCVHQRTIRAHA